MLNGLDKVSYQFETVSNIAEYLTDVVKFFFWLGLTILVYSLVSTVLFPTEFIMVPVWG